MNSHCSYLPSYHVNRVRLWIIQRPAGSHTTDVTVRMAI